MSVLLEISKIIVLFNSAVLFLFTWASAVCLNMIKKIFLYSPFQSYSCESDSYQLTRFILLLNKMLHQPLTAHP